MAKQQFDKDKTLTGGRLARDRRRTEEAIAGLGQSAGNMFGQLMTDINEGIRKGASEFKKQVGDMAKKSIKDFEDVEFAATQVGKAGFKSLDFSTRLKEIEKERFNLMNGIAGVTGEEKDARLAALAADEETYSVLQSKAEVLNKQNELMTSGLNLIDTMKQGTIDMVKHAKALFSTWEGMAVGMIAINNYLGKMGQELGVSTGQAAMLSGQTALLGPIFKAVGLDLRATQKALIENFATMDALTMKNVASMGLLQLRTGLSAENAAKASRMFSLIEGSTAAAGASMVQQVADQANLAGAIPSKVIGDMTTNSAQIAEYWSGNVESLTKAAIQASKLGLGISEISLAAGKMLDIENSIAAEMEAEVLLGRSLNLEKAREAALTGDSATLMQELVKNAGSLDEFNNMNVIQRQKLAAALGLNVQDLQKMVQEEQKSATLTGQIYMNISKWGGVIMNALPGIIAMGGSLSQMAGGTGVMAKIASKIPGLSGGAGLGKDVTPPDTGPKGPGMLSKINPTAMLKGAGAMLIMGAALWVAAKGFQQLALVDWGKLWPGAVIALVGLTAAMAGMGAMGPVLILGAAAFAAMSGALLIFGIAMMAVGKGVQFTKDGLQGFGAVIGELIPMIPGMFALGSAFGTMGLGLMSMSVGLLTMAPMLPVIMAIGAIAKLGGALGGGGATEETMEIKSTSIEDKLDALTIAIMTQPIQIQLDGKNVGWGVKNAQNKAVDFA